MKKKILALSVCVVMLAVAIVGGTLAYFTDTDDATNVFTVGNVDITLVENFTQNSKLLPGSQTKNNIPKEVKIELNAGSEDAYVWYEWYIPSALDSTDGSTGTNNVVHVNSAGSTWDKYSGNAAYWPEGQTAALPLEQTWDHDPEVELGIEVGPEGYFEQVEIDGINYNKYVVLYHGVLEAGEETSVAMTQVYLDSKVDSAVGADGTTYYTINGDRITYDFTQGVKIIVRAYGIQAAGFNDVYAAYTAYQNQVK